MASERMKHEVKIAKKKKNNEAIRFSIRYLPSDYIVRASIRFPNHIYFGRYISHKL